MYYILVVGITLTAWETKWAEESWDHRSSGGSLPPAIRVRGGGAGTGDIDYDMRVWQLAKTMLELGHPMSAFGVPVVQLSTPGVLNFC